MNFLALCLVLVLTSVATAQIPKPREEDVIVKEGRRVVVVEYEKDDGNTKVLISPQDKPDDNFVKKAKEASSSVVDEIGDLVGKIKDDENVQSKFRPRELVCDAYGKCKHKLASALGKTAEAAEEVKEKFLEGKEAAEGAAEKVKEKFLEGKEKAEGAAEGVKEKFLEGKEKAEGVEEKVKEKFLEGKEKVKEMLLEGKEKAEEAEEEVKEKLLEGKGKVEGVKEKFLEGKGKGGKGLRERVGAVVGVVHMMGFAVAYGMCVWMTFASSYVLAGAVPRRQFAVVQSKMYPVYFKGMGCGVGMALLGHLAGRGREEAVLQGMNLAAALGMILVNLMWLEPQATKVMLEKMKKDKEEGSRKEADVVEPIRKASDSAGETAGRGPTSEEAAATSEIIHLSRTLERLNSYSSFLDALTLMLLTWHLVYLGQRLNAPTC
ncbi:uncharacterized protein LOC125204752 isoform X2 [Salvia hispanica]|uniref:uncharacterized protein LOC125204752 isoform X2 n=1 Tax=Salvia hispanica TaxID=49212 RepID=UPI0020099310|nr:uncharacterized protein LOC125204752 isoform X2 [Salvia hispanica]